MQQPRRELDPIDQRKQLEMLDILLEKPGSIAPKALSHYLGHLGLPFTVREENSIIQDKLPETATDESLDNVA